MKRLYGKFSLILAAAILANLVSCGSEPVEIGGGEVSTSAEATTEPETSPLKLPEMTFEGKELRFLSRAITDTVVRYYSEIAVSEENGETMNDAVYRRTVAIEDQYKVKLVNDVSEDVTGTFTNSFMAGDDNWDVIVGGFSKMIGVAVNGGYFADLSSLPYIDFDNPWWDKRVAEDLSISGRVFTAIGAMNTWTDSHTYAVIFNKELAEQYSVDAYGMVDRNEWTLDNFSSILRKVTNDLDGNGEWDENDRYGACSEYFNFLVHMTGCGAQIMSHNKDGIPEYSFDERFYSAAEKVTAMMTGGDCLLAEAYSYKESDPWTNIIRKNFRAGNSLFYVGGIEQLLIFRDLETDIGLLPMPKYDASDEYAHTFNISWSSIMSVSALSSQQEMAAYLLEAMNYQSSICDSLDYYDIVLSRKAMRDEDSIRMLEIVRSTRTMNFEYAFSFLNLRNIYNSIIKAKDASILASSIASSLTAAEEQVAAMVEKINA